MCREEEKSRFLAELACQGQTQPIGVSELEDERHEEKMKDRSQLFEHEDCKEQRETEYERADDSRLSSTVSDGDPAAIRASCKSEDENDMQSISF